MSGQHRIETIGRRFPALALAASLFTATCALARGVFAQEKRPETVQVERQPFAAQVKRVAQALQLAGSSLTAEQQGLLQKALDLNDDSASVRELQSVMDSLCLAIVTINPESRVSVIAGPAPKDLMQQGWGTFLVKVVNEAGVTSELRCQSPNAEKLHKQSTSSPAPPITVKPSDVGDRWLDLQMNTRQPLNARLSGLPVEYCMLELYSRDVGQREGRLMFDVGQGTQDLGFRSELNVLFRCVPAVEVRLDIIDHDGTPTTGQFVIKDKLGRLYPALSRRLAPDLFFHEQVYRHDGEYIVLPPGEYDVTYTRGPEYEVLKRKMTVPAASGHRETFRLKRWVNMAARGWFSGDHHVHAAGCKHYESPAEGVQPQDMMRHFLGEDLNVGCVLSWGPCWYFQKQFFDGKVSNLSNDRYVMRYDVEVSGFPSSHAGHLCLLRLKEDDYPGTTRIEDWPSWDLPVLQWGQKQGGVVGFSHSGWGLRVKGNELPTDEVPAFDGIGANEYVVDTVFGACDFISAVDTPAIWELNVWYHTLNCGYRSRISGETDFPCIYGERVGLGRSYVKLPMNGKLDFDQWADGIRDGRSYVSDGLSHLFDFQINGRGVGERDASDKTGTKPASELNIPKGQPLSVRVQSSAWLEPKPTEATEAIRKMPWDQRPYWHVERTRVGQSRKVPVELIVNGKAVERREIDADGSVQQVDFNYTPDRSCWVAVRILPSSHTNPIFVQVDGQPIRASQRSAEWCLKAIDQCWKMKSGRIREPERPTAAAAYEKAREAYRAILAASFDDRAKKANAGAAK